MCEQWCFIILMCGDGRYCWTNSILYGYCIQNDWVSRANEPASNFALSLNIPPQKLFGWFSRPQLWATGDWQLHHGKVPTPASRLLQSVLVKHQITRVTQPHYSPDVVPCDFWLFPKLKSPLEGRDFRPLMRFRKIQQGSWWLLREPCEVSRCLLWRGLRYHCPMYNVSCI